MALEKNIPTNIHVSGVQISNTRVERVSPSHWRHNDHDGVSNHQPYDYLLNHLFGHKSKKTSKLRVTGLRAGPVNSPHKGQWRGKCFHLMTSSCSQFTQTRTFLLLSYTVCLNELKCILFGNLICVLITQLYFLFRCVRDRIGTCLKAMTHGVILSQRRCCYVSMMLIARNTIMKFICFNMFQTMFRAILKAVNCMEMCLKILWIYIGYFSGLLFCFNSKWIGLQVLYGGW